MTDFGRWSTCPARSYAPPVVIRAGSVRPPQTAGRTARLGTLFAVVYGGVWLVVGRDRWGLSGSLFWIDVAVGVASLAVLQFHHRHPVGLTILITAATAVSASAIGPWAVAQASVAAHRRWREILPTAALAILTGEMLWAYLPVQDMSWSDNLVFTGLSTAAVVAVGMYAGARRDLLASLRDRAERAEREQALQVATARVGERTLIAREMHDVLAHRMSLVALHAGALAYRTDLSPAQTRETAGVIQANSQRALADLREILGLLRDPERGVDATDHRPQPTLGDLGELLDEERAAGAQITLHSDLEDLDALPASVGRNAYRIVQEGLTNARKHSPRAPVTVELTGRPGTGLALCMRNPVQAGADQHRAGGGGFGLVGLAERAAASHGRVEHGRTSDGEFVLRAWLPWDR
jgi:signal transduction histidine kinase